jgi:hypothetical protein
MIRSLSLYASSLSCHVYSTDLSDAGKTRHRKR